MRVLWNIAGIWNADNVSLSHNKAAIKKIRKPFSILYNKMLRFFVPYYILFGYNNLSK